MQLLQMSDATSGIDRLLQLLQRELRQGKQVLWLIPGGSNIPFSVQIMQQLDDALTANLTLALTDERYGPLGHPDSNWRQLDEAGFVDKQAIRINVLGQPQQSLEATAAAYAAKIQPLIEASDSVIGQFGMGPDGHIAGILPDSPAASAADWVWGYQTPTFQRVSLTFEAISRCDSAFLFAFGAAKRSMLQQLKQDIPVRQQPAQIIKQITESYVCNDQIGEPV